MNPSALVFALLAAAAPAAASVPPPGSPEATVVFMGTTPATPPAEAALVVWAQSDAQRKEEGVRSALIVIRRLPPRVDGRMQSTGRAGDDAFAYALEDKDGRDRLCHEDCFDDIRGQRAAALAPGDYYFALQCATSQVQTTVTGVFELAAGKRYRIACEGRGRQRGLRAALTEI